MSSSRPMSRRRFIAVVGSAGGALGVAGLGGWRLLAGRDGSVAASGGFAVDPGVEIVEVEPGFVDAAVWGDELLTLRGGSTGSGIVLRSETVGRDHPVDVPVGFTARCVGVIDGTIVIGGHRDIETGQLTFEEGEDFRSLAAAAGPQAELLLGAPLLPPPVAHTHTFVDMHPSVAISNELDTWTTTSVFLDGFGGSCAAIADMNGMLVLDRYADAEVPDSVFEVAWVGVPRDFAIDDLSISSAIQVDHGGAWGTFSDGQGELLVVVDRYGIRSSGPDGKLAFSLDESHSLLGINVVGSTSMITVQNSTGERHVIEFRDGEQIAREAVNPSEPVLHRINKNLTIASSGRTHWADERPTEHLDAI